jgi:hypothetical protein
MALPKNRMWKSCNPTIEDYNNSRTPMVMPLTKASKSEFRLNEELYYRVKEYQRVHGHVSPDVIFRQLQRTNMTCRTIMS